MKWLEELKNHMGCNKWSDSTFSKEEIVQGAFESGCIGFI